MKVASAFVALLWLWIAIVYHGRFLSAINPMAPVFAVLFGIEAAMLMYMGVVHPQFVLRFRPTPRGIAGVALQLLRSPGRRVTVREYDPCHG